MSVIINDNNIIICIALIYINIQKHCSTAKHYSCTSSWLFSVFLLSPADLSWPLYCKEKMLITLESKTIELFHSNRIWICRFWVSKCGTKGSECFEEQRNSSADGEGKWMWCCIVHVASCSFPTPHYDNFCGWNSCSDSFYAVNLLWPFWNRLISFFEISIHKYWILWG